MERTLVLVKPDGVQRGLIGTAISRLEGLGLKIVAMKMLQMDEALAKKHYAIHKDKPFFNGLVNYISSGPIIAAIIEGKNAIAVVRKVMGATDPAKAESGTLRGDFGLDVEHNLVHGSDSAENAIKEISLFFSQGEIFSYPETEKGITES